MVIENNIDSFCCAKAEVGIYKKKTRKKKDRKHALDQESKIQEKTTKKIEGRKWETQIRVEN